MRAYVYDVTAMDDTCSKELVNLKAKQRNTQWAKGYGIALSVTVLLSCK